MAKTLIMDRVIGTAGKGKCFDKLSVHYLEREIINKWTDRRIYRSAGFIAMTQLVLSLFKYIFFN